MTRRATNIGTEVEYVDTNNQKRATSIGVQVEYIDPSTSARLTSIGVQVEYSDTATSGDFDTPVGSGPDDVEEAGDGTGFVSNNTYVTIESNTTAPSRKNAAFRFTGVTLPGNATVINATMLLQAVDAIDDDLYSDVYGEDADNSVDFTTNPSINSRVKTSAFATWIIDAAGTNTIESPNLAEIVQEIKDRPGWVSGNALTILVYAKIAGNKKFKAKAFEALSGAHAELFITYLISSGSDGASPIIRHYYIGRHPRLWAEMQ